MRSLQAGGEALYPEHGFFLCGVFPSLYLTWKRRPKTMLTVTDCNYIEGGGSNLNVNIGTWNNVW